MQVCPQKKNQESHHGAPKNENHHAKDFSTIIVEEDGIFFI
jgi:Cu/Zn superoxide dismutase